MAARPPGSRLKSYTPAAIVSAPPNERKHILRRAWFPAVILLALAAGGLTGIIAAYQLNYSQAASEVAALATYRPSVVTRIYADDGQTMIGEFALEKRIPLKYEEIPPVMKNAILAVEDVRFYDHIGIDPIRIVGAAWKNVTSNKVEGGSTLTQQLAKNLFLTREQSYKRKMNEWLLALQIERYYTKNQIMELYANHIFVGANSYGVEAGAETYFGKQAKDLTLDEAALLAAVPKAPGEYSPTSNPAKAKERRDLVLDLMARTGFASQSDVDALIEGVIDGTVDTIATDHAPHHRDEKMLEYDKAPFGIVGLETALSLVFDRLVYNGTITLKRMVELMSTNPSKVFSLNKGSLAPGSVADVTIFDPARQFTVDPTKFKSKSRNTPFSGWQLYGAPVAVVVGGKLIDETILNNSD